MEHDNILSANIKEMLASISPSRDNPLLIRNFHVSALFELIKQICVPSLVLVAEEHLMSVFETIQPGWELNRGLFFPPMDSPNNTPTGFQSLNSRHRLITSSVVRSFEEQISFILTTENAAREPGFTNFRNKPYIINDKTDYDSLRAWLKESRYAQSDVVSTPGTFAIRGGIIDVFSITSHVPARINFTEDTPSLFTFDVDSQVTTGHLKSLTLVNKSGESGDISLFDIFDPSFIKIYLPNESDLLIGGKKHSSKFDFPLDTIDLDCFLRLNTKNYFVSEHLVNNGFIDNSGRTVIPPWFIGRLSQKFDKATAIKKELGRSL